jgi:hypothetical protein
MLESVTSGSQPEKARSARSHIKTDEGSLAIIAQVFGDTGPEPGLFFQAALDDTIRCDGYLVLISVGAKGVEYTANTVHVDRDPGVNDVSFGHRQAKVDFFLFYGTGKT